MQVKVYKDEKESNERLVTRFNRLVQGSRKVLRLKSKRYHQKPLTKRQIRKAAVMREYYRAKKARTRFY